MTDVVQSDAPYGPVGNGTGPGTEGQPGNGLDTSYDSSVRGGSSSQASASAAAVTALTGDDATSGPSEGSKGDDLGGLVYFIMVFLGIGMLTAWNTIISAIDYFFLLYPEHNVGFTFSVAYNVSSIAILLLLVNFGARFPFQPRMNVSLVVMLSTLVLLPVLGRAPTSGVYTLTVVLIVVTGIAAAVFLGDLLGLAGRLGPTATQAVMNGNGLGGLIVAGLRVITKLGLPETPDGVQGGAMIYFQLAAAILGGCIACFYVLLRLPETKRALARTEADAHGDSLLDDANAGAEDAGYSSLYASKYADAPAQPPAAAVDDDVERPPRDGGPVGDDTTPYDPVAAASAALLDAESSNDDDDDDDGAAPASPMRVFRKVWPVVMSTFSVFFVTLSLFPGVMVSIPPHAGRDTDPNNWFPILMLSTFMVGDAIGRAGPRYFLALTPKTVWIPAAARFAYFPVFAWLFKAPPPDLITVLIALTFSISNGYTGTCSMMFAAELVKPRDKATAGTIGSFCLNAGIFFGVWFAVAMLFFLTGEVHL